MDILRKIGLGLCAFVLPFTLFGTALSHAASVTVLKPDALKRWLDESDFYERIVDTALQSADEDMSGDSDSSDIPSQDPQVQAITKQVFTPDFLRGNIEQILDGVYAWLEGKTDKPTFMVDLSEAKQHLADELGSYAVSRARSLPACSKAQLQELAGQGSEFEALSSDCLPPGVDPQAAGIAVRNEVLMNKELLGQTSFTGDDLNIQEGPGQKIQDAYQRARYAPYLFGGLALLATAGIVFLSSHKRSGVRRAGVVFVTTGILLGLFRLVFSTITRLLENYAETATDSSRTGSELASALLRAIGKDIGGLLGWYALAFVLIGVAGLLLAHFYKRSGPDPQHPDTPKPSDPKISTGAAPEQNAPQKSKTPPKIQL